MYCNQMIKLVEKFCIAVLVLKMENGWIDTSLDPPIVTH